MKKRQSNLTIFAILTTITVLTWVFVEGYQRFYKSEFVPVPIKLLSPLSPSLDINALKGLEEKKFISPTNPSLNEVAKTQSKPTATPPPIPSIQEATQSGEQTQPASGSATAQ